MGLPKRRTVSLNTRTSGRVTEDVPPPPPPDVVFSFPAGRSGLEAKHGDRWAIEGELGHYEARRFDTDGEDAPILSPLTVSHATAQGLDAALTALGDLR